MIDTNVKQITDGINVGFCLETGVFGYILSERNLFIKIFFSCP